MGNYNKRNMLPIIRLNVNQLVRLLEYNNMKDDVRYDFYETMMNNESEKVSRIRLRINTLS